MPGMNGWQLAEAARQLRPGLKVLFVTGYSGTAAQEVKLRMIEWRRRNEGRDFGREL